jgi:hypothetical protein
MGQGIITRRPNHGDRLADSEGDGAPHDFAHPPSVADERTPCHRKFRKNSAKNLRYEFKVLSALLFHPVRGKISTE